MRYALRPPVRAVPGRTLTTLLAISLLATGMAPVVKPLAAQGLVSVGVGAGGGVGDRNKDQSGSGTHGAAYVQFRVPVIPFALRADALLAKTAKDASALSLMADAVVIAPIPFVQPYVLAGYGKYGIGTDGSASGWNAGVGARVRTPWIAVYAEARRHQRISRDLLTIGISR